MREAYAYGASRLLSGDGVPFRPGCWAGSFVCSRVGLSGPSRSEVCAAMKRMTEIERSKAGEPSVPDFLTIEEAADVVRIGRTAAYRLARQYLATGGAIGIPAVRFGKQLRVPRCKLEAALGGPITWPLHEPKTAVELARVAAAPSLATRAAPSRPSPAASPRLFSL